MSRGRSARVLIVEDDVLQALALADDLRDAGYDVVATTAAVHESVEVLNRHDIDVAVLDLELGGRISIPVASLLRKQSIPFVVVTGHDVGRFAEELGGAPVFQKPVPKDILLDALAGLLNASPSAAPHVQRKPYVDEAERRCAPVSTIVSTDFRGDR